MIPTEDITYDNYGRMKYHPDYHFSHGKRFSESDLEYICKFYGTDNTRALGFAIGKTEATIRSKINALMATGEYEYYRNLNKHW